MQINPRQIFQVIILLKSGILIALIVNGLIMLGYLFAAWIFN